MGDILSRKVFSFRILRRTYKLFVATHPIRSNNLDTKISLIDYDISLKFNILFGLFVNQNISCIPLYRPKKWTIFAKVTNNPYKLCVSKKGLDYLSVSTCNHVTLYLI